MADRVVRVRYEALVDGAIANTKRLGAATKDYATRSAQHLRDNEAAMSRLTTGLAVGATAVGVGVGAMTKQWMGFDQQMSGVRAVAGATADEMAKLEQAAIDLGASTTFSASEVASAQAELVKAGVSVEDMLSGGLKGALDLAAAGGLELADASTIAAQAMNLFNLEGKDVPRVADVLASAANKSAADVGDLGEAMQQAGTVASQTGLSLEETAAALAMFADQGIRGSDAGTSLKTMLQRLTPQSKEAQQVMDDLGFSAYDAQGNFIGLEALAGELQDSFGGLDAESRNAALGVAFGSDAIRAASILMEGGATAARKYESAMHDQGAAARMAGEMTDNLAGDLEELGGALETLLIQGGQRGDGFLRGLTQGLTGLVDIAASSPGWLQDATLALGGLVTVGGLGAAGVLKMGTSLVSFGDNLASVAGKSTRMSAAISGIGGMLASGPWAFAMAAGVGALSLFALEQGKARVEAEELRATLDEQTGAVTENTRAWQTKKLQDEGWLDQYESWGGSIADLTGYINGEAGARERVTAVLDQQNRKMIDAGNVSEVYGTEAQRMRDVLNGMAGDVDEQAEKTRQLAAAQESGARSTAALEVESRRLTAQAEAYFAGQEAATTATDRWSSAAERAAAAGGEAAAAYQAQIDALVGSTQAFVDGSGAMSAHDEAMQSWAQGQADATASADDSWQDFWDGQSFNVDVYIAELAEMVEAQAVWERNMVLLAGSVSQGVLDELARLGPEGAVLAQALVDDTSGVLTSQMEAAFGDPARAGTAAYARAMTDARPIIKAAGARWGDDIAREIAAKLASGERTAEQIVREYDLAATVEMFADDSSADRTRRDYIRAVAESDPLMRIYAATDDARREMGRFFSAYQGTRIGINLGFGNENGALHDRGTRYADGGIDAAGRHVPRVPQMGGPAYGKRYITWGEDVTGWEAYISGKPGMEARNRAVLAEAARRLGMTVLDGLGVPQARMFANGGMWSTLDLRVTERDRFDEAIQGAKDNYLAPLGGKRGVVKSMPWPLIWGMVKSIAPEARMTSNFRPGARTAGYGNTSLHALGRAIDIVSSNMAGTFMKILTRMPWPNELIHTPMGGLQINRGGIQTSNFPLATRLTHLDHIHLGYKDGGLVRPFVADSGALLRPGLNLLDNRTGGPEPLMRMDQPMRITGRLEIGGDGLATLVDGRIAADRDQSRYESRMVGV